MAKKLSKEFKRVYYRELRCIQRDHMDGCFDCKCYGTCNKLTALCADLAKNPKKYIEMKQVNGVWKSKRLIEV